MQTINKSQWLYVLVTLWVLQVSYIYSYFTKLNITDVKVNVFKAQEIPRQTIQSINKPYLLYVTPWVLQVNNYFSHKCFTKLNITDVKVSIISAASITQADDTKQK